MSKLKLFGWWALVLAAGMVLTVGPFAQAEDFPNKPVSMIVAYSPGGATDFQARIVTMLAQKTDLLGQPMVIINKPGAGGQVGWNWFVAKGTRDG